MTCEVTIKQEFDGSMTGGPFTTAQEAFADVAEKIAFNRWGAADEKFACTVAGHRGRFWWTLYWLRDDAEF